MPRGGKRPGAGRPKGARNKKTVALAAAIEASGLPPLDYMLAVMRNPAEPQERRMAMAKAAAPYVHTRLRARANPGDGGPAAITWIERVIIDQAEDVPPAGLSPRPSSSSLGPPGRDDRIRRIS
jgi:hypothetical protein